jgi:hypothetical protein
MKNEKDDDLGRKLRERLENFEVPYNEADWESLKKQLLPPKKTIWHRFTPYKWAAAALLLLGLGISWFLIQHTDNQFVANKNNPIDSVHQSFTNQNSQVDALSIKEENLPLSKNSLSVGSASKFQIGRIPWKQIKIR